MLTCALNYPKFNKALTKNVAGKAVVFLAEFLNIEAWQGSYPTKLFFVIIKHKA